MQTLKKADVFKFLSLSIITMSAILLPVIAAAQGGFLGGGDGGEIKTAATAITSFISSVVLPLLFAIGFLVFVWGMIKFFIIGASNDDAKASGKSLILYSLAAFIIIFAFWGIVNIFVNGIGLGDANLDRVPGVPAP